jgi:endonuclease YncB( thermonuclease family)
VTTTIIPTGSSTGILSSSNAQHQQPESVIAGAVAAAGDKKSARYVARAPVRAERRRIQGTEAAMAPMTAAATAKTNSDLEAEETAVPAAKEARAALDSATKGGQLLRKSWAEVRDRKRSGSLLPSSPARISEQL